MNSAYQKAKVLLLEDFTPETLYLDCGTGGGGQFERHAAETDQLAPLNYFGIEWNHAEAVKAKKNGLQVVRAELNRPLPFEDEIFGCVFGLSVLEHLVNGCQFMKEAYGVLKPGGRMVLITPNLSAWFKTCCWFSVICPHRGRIRIRPHWSEKIRPSDSGIQGYHMSKMQFQPTDTWSYSPTKPFDIIFTASVLKG